MYAEEGWPERKAAERAAVTRIFGLLPDPHGAKFMALAAVPLPARAPGSTNGRGDDG